MIPPPQIAWGFYLGHLARFEHHHLVPALRVPRFTVPIFVMCRCVNQRSSTLCFVSWGAFIYFADVVGSSPILKLKRYDDEMQLFWSLGRTVVERAIIFERN